MVSIDDRKRAIRILGDILQNPRPIDPEKKDEASPWIREVCSGVLRWKTRLENAIDENSDKKKPSGWLRRALLVGAYQLIAQRKGLAASAVIETVELVKKVEGVAPAKFANALLRKIEKNSEMYSNLHSITSSAQACLPEWIWKLFLAQRGSEWTEKFARSSFERPVTWVRSRDPQWNPSADFEKGPIDGSWKVVKKGPIPALEGFNEGAFYVQDISVQAVLNDLSKVFDKQKSREALDVCAAPGGKSIGLALQGWTVDAADPNAERLKLLADSTARMKLSDRIRLVQEDQAKVGYDLIWIDAPCTSSGIIRRHPDVKWNKKPEDVDSAVKLQAQILGRWSSHVRPGGYLLYSVCSVFKQEGSRHFERDSFAAWKQIHKWELNPFEEPFGDGFWACLLQKPK